MNSREGESQDNQHDRSNRIIQINGSWFFLTREASQEGPFANRDETAEALRLFTAVMSSHLSPSNPSSNPHNIESSRASESTATKEDIARLRELLEKNGNSQSLKKLDTLQNEHISVTNIEFTQVAKDSTHVKTRSRRSANDASSFCGL